MLNELVYKGCLWFRRIKYWAVPSTKSVIFRGIAIERDFLGKFNKLREIAASVSVASSLQRDVLIIDSHFHIVVGGSHIFPKLKDNLRCITRVCIESMLEGCRHSYCGIIVVWVEEELQDLRIRRIVFVLVYSGHELVHCTWNHTIDKEPSCRFIISKSLIIVVKKVKHHIVNESLICKRLHREDHIEIPRPNRVCILGCLSTAEGCWIFVQ